MLICHDPLESWLEGPSAMVIGCDVFQELEIRAVGAVYP